ncbi:MAG: phytoene desaturase family protein [Deltaproteobacteria bacterium]
MKKIVILGSGFSSLSAACYLADAGYDVTILEKNSEAGGRARQLKKDGFIFDIGPTFYWMPDVFDRFFADFGKKTSDYYELVKLDPGYQVYFGAKDSISISADVEKIKAEFEKNEPGSASKLQKFINNARENYEIAINDLVYKPGQNLMEIVNFKTFSKLFQFVDTIKAQVGRSIKNPKLRQIMEFPVLFLGAKPSNTPAFYNFMNYADFGLGTWHPKGGMYMVVEALKEMSSELGVRIIYENSVEKINIRNKKAVSVTSNGIEYECDILLSGADYHHTETLMPVKYRQYSESYWKSRTFAPSALLFYIGFNKKIKNVAHHTLFFETDFEEHARAIYDTITYPENPLFYASFPSKTDFSSAPDGKEAGIFLIPLAPGLREDNEEIRNKYLNIIINRLEKATGQELRNDVIFYNSFSVNDFISQYNSYKGNAYGLANTLLQTHVLKPRLQSAKVKNLFFTGQLTVPGPGVPPSLISGKIVSELIIRKNL